MVKERRICVCGGVIAAENNPDAIAKAVQVHQRTSGHRDYVDRVLTENFAVPSARLVKVS